MRSLIEKVRHSAESRFQLARPGRVERPTLPYCPGAFPTNAVVSKNRERVFCETCQSPTTLGRSLPTPVRERSVPEVTVSQAAEAAVKMLEKRQSPAKRWIQREPYFGLWTTNEVLNICRWSEAQFPHSARRLVGLWYMFVMSWLASPWSRQCE